MPEIPRSAAVERVADLVATVESERMPVPVREVWVYGDVALGLDPVERIDVYLAKDVLLGDSDAAAGDEAGGEEPALPPAVADVDGVGETVRTDWAADNPGLVRTNAGGYAAPEKCLAAHLLEDDEPVHLEVCNASFEDNVTQRLEGALAREAYERILDPRGACLWVDGRRSAEAFEKLRRGEYVFPTLSGALEMLGADADIADEAADAVREFRASQEGATVRGDVV